MKKLFYICLLLLCQLTAFAQGDETKYTLTVQTDPKGTYAEFQWRRLGVDTRANSRTSTELKIEVAAGQQVDFGIKRYSYASYKPVYLMSEGTRLPIIEQTSFEATSGAVVAGFIMPDHDATVTVVMEYDPALPPNPNKEDWNEQTGAIVVNDFVPGNLQYTIRDAIAPDSYNADYTKVKSITVCGEMAENDWNLLYYNYFTNLTYFDISRSTGLDVLDYRYSNNDNETLTTLLLPANIKTIGRGFSVFKALRSLTCFATTPPELTNDALKDLSAEAEVFVPAESLPLYAEAEGWKDLNLMPITQGVHKLTVNMPANADMKQLKDMYLELTNVKTGQTRRYVLTNRTQYTFTNLIENTLYNVYIRNARENILGTIEAVNIEKKDVQVTFPALKPLRDVTLQLTVPDGSPVGTDAFTTTWTDAVGNYLAKGATLTAQVEGTKAIAHVKLGQELGTQYQQPADTMFTVGQGLPLTIRLTPLPQAELTGTVTAAATGLPIRSANISVTQQLNGLYPVTLTTTTDKDGQWTLTAYAAQTTVTVQAPAYIPQTHALSVLAGSPGEAQLFSLEDLTGTTVSLDLSYRSAAREGEQPSTDFSGYADIAYTVYDETHQQDVADITVENGSIVLNGLDLAEGTRLSITAKSLTGAFADATATCTVGADGKATATLPLTEYGSLIATFSETENLSVTGMLFKTSGELVARGYYQTTEGYDKPTVFFNHIPDGQYLLIIMGESKLYNSFATLGALLESGLQSKVDYVGHNIDIASGRIDSVHNQSVPTFDETVYYCTGDNTRFSVNKSQVTVGNYVTLRAQVDFKPGITPSDVELLFDLPDGCQLVEGSVMAGNQLSTYEVDGNRVTVPLDNISDQIRFCVVPTAEGYYEPTANVCFSNGNTVMQPIGSVAITAEALRIDVPERSAKGKLPVCGVAPASAQVQIYDDGVLIGHTDANPNGSWSLTCQLNKPYNLSIHPIYAVVTNSDGVTMQTETRNVTVRFGTLTPVVHGAYYNDVHGNSYVINWDFRDNTVTPTSYGWPLRHTVPWTFAIDFKDGDETVNDTTAISNVVLYVLRSNDTYIALDARFSKARKQWWAQADFDADATPKNVYVDFVQNEVIRADRQELDDMRDETIQTITEHQQMVKEAYELAYKEIVPEEDPESVLREELMQLFNIENPDEATLARIDELMEILYPGDDETELVDPEKLEKLPKYVPITKEERDRHCDQMLSLLSTAMSTDTISTKMEEGERQMDIPLTNGVIHYTSKSVTSIDEQALLSEGYTKSPLTDGSSIYYLNTGTKEAYLDSRNMIHLILEWEEGAKAGARPASPRKSHWDVMDISELFDQAEMENLKRIDLKLWEILYNNPVQSPSALTQAYLGQGKSLSRELFISANKLYKGGLENIDRQLRHIYWNNKEEYNDSLKHYQSKYKNGRSWAKFYEEYLRKRPGLKVDEPDWYSHIINEHETACFWRDSAPGRIEYYEDLLKKNENDYQRIYRDIVRNLPKDLITTTSYRLNLGLKYENSPVGLLHYLQLCFYVARNTNDDLGEWQKTYNAIRAKIPCEGNEDEAIQLMTETMDAIVTNGGEELRESFYMGAHCSSIYNKFMEGYNPEKTQPLSWYLLGANLGEEGDFYFWADQSNMMHYYINKEKEQFNTSKNQRKDLDDRINALKCKKPKDEDENKPVKVVDPSKPNDPNKTGGSKWSPNTNTTSIYDPSGFVYEAVESNRLEGVKATCFYKEMKEDKYGDLYENVVVWDAENYAQENPLFTDADGQYAWDVPTGLWQVKYEKEGYETAYSEWLPVPPPQLEVNMGMKQLRQPAVSHVKACTDGIDITFDKYMDPQTLTTENILLTKGGQTVGGKIELLNAESGYASKLRFVPDGSVPGGLPAESKVQLTVRKAVESYAGLQMEQDFTQQFDVEQRITAIVADTVLYMAEGTEQTVTVTLLPAEAAKGKKLQVSGADDGIVSHKNGELTLDASGQAAVVLTANSLGSSAVRFTLTDDADLTATTTVIVRNPALMYVYAPKSSRMSGTEIYRGAEIRLTCQTAGATILYTLDGSCPCDAQNANVLTYTGPITATGTELNIKAMAVANGMAESDVAEFKYKVIDNPVGIEPTPVTQHLSPNTTYYRLDGRRTAKLQKGLNIVRQADGTVRKVVRK